MDAYREFYLRPGYMFSRLKHLKHLSNLKHLLVGFNAYRSIGSS